MRSNSEQITWQLLPLVLTQNVEQLRTNYLAAAASGIDTKCKASLNKLPGNCFHNIGTKCEAM
jgi:hypothetical protein